MTKVKQAYLERQKDYDAFKRRFDVIDQLRASQAGPVPLLTSLSDTVNKTEGVWLLNMRDDGASVALDGVALGPNPVANLMTNLRRSGYFKNVELHETFQEDTPEAANIQFQPGLREDEGLTVMASFKELPYVAKIGIVALVIILLAVAAYLFALNPLPRQIRRMR